MNKLIIFSILLANSIPVFSSHSFQSSAIILESEKAPLFSLSKFVLTLSKRKKEIKTFKTFDY